MCVSAFGAGELLIDLKKSETTQKATLLIISEMKKAEERNSRKVMVKVKHTKLRVHIYIIQKLE